jgi:hypothetical protein
VREVARPAGTFLLELPPAGGRHRKPPRESLSAVVLHGRSLFLATDEGTVLDRLTLREDGSTGEPATYPMLDVLDLPNRTGEDDEIDIEGMDVADGRLWIVGSHARTRKKPGKADPLGDLARVVANPNRHVLACLPLLSEGAGLFGLPGAAGPGVARLGIGRKSGALTKALKKDGHLRRFLKLPAKENGFDVEGIAIRGERVLLGLRAPVLRGWALVLGLELEPDGDGLLALRPSGVDGQRYHKHLLDLGGNGVRDLARDGDDLLVLAGPSMDLDGHCAIWRWHGAWSAPGDGLVPQGKGRLERLLRLPVGVDGDRPEGITLLPGGRELLVVYDRPAKARCRDEGAVHADRFALPDG